jgi:hypothetical protein
MMLMTVVGMIVQFCREDATFLVRCRGRHMGQPGRAG